MPKEKGQRTGDRRRTKRRQQIARPPICELGFKQFNNDNFYFHRKMYQHSRVELKNKMISYDVQDKEAVKRAQQEGNLHETLLDRRTKLKSDKYC